MTFALAAGVTAGEANAKPRDMDRDGISNLVDLDVDGDGISNGKDANVDGGICRSGRFKGKFVGDRFPNGSNREKDIDGDGLADDSDQEKDIDGDGLLDDSGLERDIDGDGKLDDSDLEKDIDGDGLADDSAEEKDMDGDGLLDDANEEEDIDGDGLEDLSDEENDVDGDGKSDNTDEDIDGDGLGNSMDLTMNVRLENISIDLHPSLVSESLAIEKQKLMPAPDSTLISEVLISTFTCEYTMATQSIESSMVVSADTDRQRAIEWLNSILSRQENSLDNDSTWIQYLDILALWTSKTNPSADTSPPVMTNSASPKLPESESSLSRH